ncbi:MAG: hypothetical protein FWE95_00275 [Planctomycetaceae bacterium]|nr:hypothetical protein [Planctomycetaceae bacterium]
MTGLYVRSNVQALTSQNYLNRNLADLGNIMTRLSTGLRINSGKDDPAGLIASELIKADMTATTKAITNTQRANSMVAIADSALGQISNLLNDIRGLVNESANTGTMTYEQIYANQLQVNAAIDSIDRIAKTTNYLGKNLLDGSLDFQTKGLDRTAVKNLSIHQANFGTAAEVNIGINVMQDSSAAQLVYDKAGVSQDTVIEIAGNNGSNLIQIAGGSSVVEIAAAINLSSDATGVRAVVGKDATAGQIFLTSAGLDNDINLTALMTGAAAGNYTIKFSASDTGETTYTITEPQNGRPGIIDFKLKMQAASSPFVEKFDESFNGIYTYDISGDRTANGFDIVVQSTNGTQIRHIEYVQSAGPNPSVPGGVAATFNKATGKLQILYDASGNLTEDALKRAINSIDELEYLGIYEDGVKFPSVNISDEIGGAGMSGVFINHTDPVLNTPPTTITFANSGTGRAVSVETSVAGTITVTKGSDATYDDVLAALNASGSWAVTATGIRPAPNSFKLVDEGGIPIKGTGVAATGSATLSSTVVDSKSNEVGTIEFEDNASNPGNFTLQFTHVDWNDFLDNLTGASPIVFTSTLGAGNAVEITLTNAEITIDVGEDATYDDVLNALKNTPAWTTTGYIGDPIPPALGLTWVGTLNPVTTTVYGDLDLGGGDATGAVTAEVAVSPASAALQTWLAANGTGTKAAIDMRANNALNITAAVPGTKFENTDIVYVKAEGAVFSEAFRLGYQNVYASTDSAALEGYTIKFGSQSTPGVALTNDTANKVLTVDIGTGVDIDAVLLAIKGLGGDWSNFTFLDATQADVSGSQSATSLVGKSLTLGKVQMDYRDIPTQAAATITLNDGEVKMRIVADAIGTCYNDVAIQFEQDNSFKPGDVSVVYDEARKILHIRGQIDGPEAATYGALKAAIEKASPFHVDITTISDNKAYPLSNQLHSGLSTAGSGITGLTENKPGNSAVIRTGQYVGDVGGNNQTLYITVSGDATANDVVDAFRTAKGPSAQIAANFIVSNALDNDGTGAIFSSVFDRDVNVRVFSGALTGGNTGLLTDVTAKELVEFINNDAVLSKLFRADVARGQVGNGFLTLFDEAAYYGSTIDDNALQFLGPKGSPDVLFVIDGPNSPLGISFADNYGSGCIADNRPVASLNAKNANAAFSVQALLGGSEYDDMVVRMIRLDNNHEVTDSYAQYKAGPSNAMAYCSINGEFDGTTGELGKFIVYANNGGDQFNDVNIVARLNEHQTEPATAYYDAVTKQLIITVNSADVQLTEAVAAINNEGTFRAEYDFSFNTDPTDGSMSTSPGLATFDKLLSLTGTKETTIGNTGNTGGHKGGVLEVYVGGKAEEITANAVISTINGSPTTKSLFNATPIGGTDAGIGVIDFRADNVRQVLGSDGKLRNEVNMVTGILGSDENAASYMIIHLATDKNGNSITTAQDLVKFFDMLTPEQTRGISVSVVRPPGVDNLDRIWTVDSCGNLIETQLCDMPYGLGILQPTYEVDDCYNYTYFPIEFFSYGQDIRPGNSYGSVIAQGGIDASLDIRSKVQGPDFNGVGFKYVKLSDPMAQMFAEYDGYNKMITVFIHEGTTASQVKGVIESSEQTRNIFEVTLPGNGSGVVSLQDDYLLLKGGLFDAGYRGGAAMLGAADADANKLTLESIAEGSRQYVSVRWLDGGLFNVKDANGNTVDTAHGTDMVATINGMRAKADGRSLSLDSAMLKLGIILDGKVTTGDQVNFTITGGGAVIQMGADVVSNQQIRFGIQSISSAHLGGASGRLYQLREGGAADLMTSDASRKLADRIVNEAIMYVAQTRGRIGAIQRNTLEPQINALQDSLVAMSAAEAQISNADFAEESSRLTRAQILVQAGTRTLSIANQFPQYAAALLGG